MRNIKITIEYDGSRYQGWTRLGKDESNNTISAKIIDVLGKMTGEKNIELNCGCRTEVGVHAYAQVANFKTSSNLSTKDIQHYLNRYLPMDIAITEVEEVPDRFHAQLNAVSKTYVYRMTIRMFQVFLSVSILTIALRHRIKRQCSRLLFYLSENMISVISLLQRRARTRHVRSTTLTFMEIMRKCRSSFRQTIFCTTWQDL